MKAKVTTIALVLLFLTLGAEAELCKARSRTFKGRCTRNDNCVAVCMTENFTGLSAPLKERTDLNALASKAVNPIIETNFIPDPALKTDRLGASELASAELSPRAISSTTGGSGTQADPEYTSGTSTAEIPTLHKLLDRIQAMGMRNGQGTIYDWIRISPDDREIHMSSITHLVSTIK
ncbi:Defensin-like protein 6 [Hordeum vulgare]|nr:Defensin-like protein 6 [Hordeum vulgare]